MMQGMEKVRADKSVPKASVVMDTEIRPKDIALQQCNGYGTYYG
jgi:hypothetical protein